MTDPNTSVKSGLLQPLDETIVYDAGAPDWDAAGEDYDTHPAPPYDAVFDAVFQPLLTGLTGIAGNMVNPKWQLKSVPNMPDNMTNWVAFGVMEHDGGGGSPFIGHQSTTWDQRTNDCDDSGQATWDTPDEKSMRDVLQVIEEISILCSFYGPQARALAAQMKHGLLIPQNRESLTRNGMGLIEVGTIRSVPEKISNFWYYRCDVIVYIRREVIRTYPVLDLLSAQGSLTTDVPLTTRKITVSNA